MAQELSTIAAFRYGLGFARGAPDVTRPGQLVDQVRGPDALAEVFPTADFASRVEIIKTHTRLRSMQKRKDPDFDRQAFRKARRARVLVRLQDTRQLFQRALFSPNSFRERLAFFWADHFTVVPKSQYEQVVWGDYITNGIRAHVGGSFADLLIAAVTHPSMLMYLDQVRSVGPNSPIGQRRKVGLNENLAREILELHTLGVGGAYRQADVRQLAELLTGLRVGDEGRTFVPRRAEPGAEEVLGRTYGGRRARIEDIEAFLRDVAVHPDTARHIALKLAVHFVDDTPDPDLVGAMAETFRDTGGDLPSVYGAMLDHPAGWAPLGDKAKQPLDFMVSGLRALGVAPDQVAALTANQANRQLAQPLAAMGQPLRDAPGPNGWPEEAEAWITAQGLAARLQWSLLQAQRFGEDLDPREFVTFALRELAGDTLRRAVAGAEDRAEGLTLVLASPEFNRR
ncbi:MAG: DUF1800 domain-containing protein [Pseudomonadota bacterium]